MRHRLWPDPREGQGRAGQVPVDVNEMGERQKEEGWDLGGGWGVLISPCQGSQSVAERPATLNGQRGGADVLV